MSRLQKKCLIATVGLHLLLVLTVVFGAAFFTSRPKPDDTQVLDVIPANLIDAAFNSGVQAAPPPAPTPVVKPPEPTPPPAPVKPVVSPPTLMERVEKIFKPAPERLPPDDLQPVTEAEKPPRVHKIQPDLKPVVHKVSPVDPTAADEAREARHQRETRLKAIAAAARAIKENATSATKVEMFGSSSVSYANYASVVKSIYEQAWTPPDDTASDDANTRVSVTIGSDGSVISARILNASGDTRVDASVQRTLDRVTFIAPFPDGAKEKAKTFIINFNLKAKRNIG